MDINFFVKISRSFLGLVLIIFGLNFFIGFLGIPIHDANAVKFISTMNELGFFFPVFAASCLIMGVLLVANLYVPSVVLLLFPFNLNILLFNILYASINLSLSIAMFIAHLFLLWFYRNNYIILKK